MNEEKVVLLLGANSDVAKEAIKLYVEKGYRVIAASRSTDELEKFAEQPPMTGGKVTVLRFDALDFNGHEAFYDSLPEKPHVVVYAAGFQIVNEEAMWNW